MTAKRKTNRSPSRTRPNDAEAPIARPRKFSVEVERALLFAAERGWPKNLAAPYAGIAGSTLHEWLSDDREPFASFAAEFQRRFAAAGGDLVDAVRLSDPKYLLGAVHQIKATEKHELSGPGGAPIVGALLTDDELLAKARMLRAKRAADGGT